jgi:hypothetical protein
MEELAVLGSAQKGQSPPRHLAILVRLLPLVSRACSTFELTNTHPGTPN